MVSKYDRTKAHEDLRELTGKHLQAHYKSIRIFDRYSGLFYKRRVVKNSAIHYSPIKIGGIGRCDDWAVLPCYFQSMGMPQNIEQLIPVHIEIETKTGEAVLSPDQIAWKNFCNMMGWIHIENRDPMITMLAISNALTTKGLAPWMPLNRV